MWENFILFVEENFFLLGYGITLIASLISYRKYFDTTLKYFPILITYTFLNELLGYLVKTYPQFYLYNDIKFSSFTEIIYNIYALVSFAFFYFVYWKLISNKKYKSIIFIGSIIVLLSYAISTFFQNPKDTNLFYATAIGSWALVFFVLLYFLDKYNHNEKLIQPNNLMFWVSVSLLIFYSALPILFIIGYTDYETWEKYNLRTVLRVLIIIMYGTLTFGFFKGQRRFFG